MRKVILIVLVVLLVLTGCASPIDKNADPNEKIENDILQRITKKHGDIVKSVLVDDAKGAKTISAHLVDDVDYDNLGTYFKSIVGICTSYSVNKKIDFLEVIVSVFKDGDPVFSYKTTYGEYDYLWDCRGEENEIYAVKSPDELEELLQTIK